MKGKAIVAGGLLVVLFVAAAADADCEWITVGHAGNHADPLNSSAIPGIGSVAYEYRIAATEVTNADYVEFLNSVDPSGANPHEVYSVYMASDLRGGIVFSASAPAGQKYDAKPNMHKKPVNYVSYFDSMRFVNWLDSGKTGNTEDGVYDIVDGLSETRRSGAKFFLPSESEWYKAAFHQPASLGGDADDYWAFATASNAAPTVATANADGDIANPGVNVANYYSEAEWNGVRGNVTTVASAGQGSSSFYGTFDQCGNVWEWTEEAINTSRVLRGGSFINNTGFLESSARISYGPRDEGDHIGFRVACVIPEPSCLLLLVLGGLAVVTKRA